MIAGIMVSANAGPAVLRRTGPAALLASGLGICAGALLWLSFLTVESTYAAGILGPLVLMGLGLGTAIATSIDTATTGVGPADAGIASAAVNAVQQLGGSVGIALLATVAGAATTSMSGAAPAVAAVHGYATAFAVAAAISLAAAVTVGLLVPARRPAARRTLAQPASSQDLVGAHQA